MPIDAGDLDKRIRIEADTPTKDLLGNDVSSWAELTTIWARIFYGRGDERRQAAQESGSVVATFQIRRTSTTRGITAAHRLRFDPAGLRSHDDEDAPAWDIIAPPTGIGLDDIEITARCRTAGGGV